jgi:hypothetical protein
MSNLAPGIFRKTLTDVQLNGMYIYFLHDSILGRGKRKP